MSFYDNPEPSQTEEAPETFTEKVKFFFTHHWKIAVPTILVLIVVIIAWQMNSSNSAASNEARVKALAEEARASQAAAEDASTVEAGEDALLAQKQPDLTEKFGTVTPGFIWDLDGTMLSLGDPKMEPDEVAYTYLRAVNTLDFTTAQKYSRRSSVTASYGDFFDKTTASSIDYKEKFKRESYRQALLSLQVQSVDRSANFSGNKQAYTVTAKMLDLSNKDFWVKDQNEIFNKLSGYKKGEDDPTKADLYLYEYVTNAYITTVQNQSKGTPQDTDIPMKTVTFDITLQKYPAQKSGWLVSIDRDLDLLCKYSEGTNVVDYIRSQYQDWETSKLRN